MAFRQSETAETSETVGMHTSHLLYLWNLFLNWSSLGI